MTRAVARALQPCPGTPAQEAIMATVNTRQLAVVTGASSGIGLELARQCVAHELDLVICAEDESISAAAVQLGLNGARVAAVRADLSTYDGVESLVAAIAATGRPVAALLLNA